MRGPGGAGDEIPVDYGIGEIEFNEGATGELDFGRAGGVGVELAAFQDAGGSEKLWAVAKGCDGLAGFVEVADDVEDFFVEAEIFGGAAAWDDKAEIVCGVDLIEGGVEREVVAAFFGVGLVAFEVVDGGADLFAGFFAGANGVNGVAYHLQCLKGDHDFVVFNEVAGEEEEFCEFHCVSPGEWGSEDSVVSISEEQKQVLHSA